MQYIGLCKRCHKETNSIMKSWSLSQHQYVLLRHHRITFGDTYSQFHINMNQFQRLDHFITFGVRGPCHLSSGVWLKGRSLVTARHAFTFDRLSWYKYRREVHFMIRSFVYHERKRRARVMLTQSPSLCQRRHSNHGSRHSPSCTRYARQTSAPPASILSSTSDSDSDFEKS